MSFEQACLWLQRLEHNKNEALHHAYNLDVISMLKQGQVEGLDGQLMPDTSDLVMLSR